MNRTELIVAISEKANVTKKDADAMLRAFTETVTDQLANGDAIQLVGFGTFKVKERPARKGVNPSTGKKINLPASKAPKFAAGKALKDTVNA